MTGLEVARGANGRCHVVFVTAYDKYAVAAFEQQAVDYILKPYSRDRLGRIGDPPAERARGQPANLDGMLESLARTAGGTNDALTLDHGLARTERAVGHRGEGSAFFRPTTSTRWS